MPVCPPNKEEMAARYAVDGSISGNRWRDVERYTLEATRSSRRSGGWAGRKWQLARDEFTEAQVTCSRRGRIEPGVAHYRNDVSRRYLNQPGVDRVLFVERAVVLQLQHVIVNVSRTVRG